MVYDVGLLEPIDHNLFQFWLSHVSPTFSMDQPTLGSHVAPWVLECPAWLCMPRWWEDAPSCPRGQRCWCDPSPLGEFMGISWGCHEKSWTGWWLSHPSEKYDFVSWDDDIPIYGKIKNVPNHQSVNFLRIKWDETNLWRYHWDLMDITSK